MRLALSTLCEHPARPTGLTTLFHEFIASALRQFADVDWIVYAGPAQEWTIRSPRVELVRRYPANDRLALRLLADHVLVPADARRRGADALLTVGFVPLRKRLPVIMHLLSLHHLDSSNRSGFARRVYRRMVVDGSVRRADVIITNSQFAAGQIRRVYPGCAPRLVVSPEGLQPGQFRPEPDTGEAARLRETFGISPGYLLWTSNFYAYKQADRLLDAFALLDPALRRQRPLVMAGGDWNGGLEAARAQAAALGIADDVRFLGWVPEDHLAPLYRQARALVLASREETFGRSTIEAMACGTPCVVNDIPIMHEVTGGHALIADFGDAPAAAAALASLLTDDAVHARLRAEGFAWAGQFSFDRLTTERIAAIRAALARPSNPDEAARNRAALYPGHMEPFKLALRALGLRVARRIGSPVVDARTGQVIGRALLVPFRGRVHVIGLDAAVLPVFLPQGRLTYWKQELGFTVHPPPDFPHEPGA